MNNQKGFTTTEILISVGLWFVMVAGISSVVLTSSRTQSVTANQDISTLFEGSMRQYFINPANCSSSMGSLTLNYGGTPSDLTINGFPFKVPGSPSDTVNLTAGAKLNGDGLVLDELKIKLKYSNAISTTIPNTPADANVISVWYNNQQLFRNTAVITASFSVTSGDFKKSNFIKVIEVPVLINPATNIVQTCTDDSNKTVESACSVVYSKEKGYTNTCEPTKIEFKGTYHTREVVGNPYATPCDTSLDKVVDTALPGWCPIGTYWSKDLPNPPGPSCQLQGICAPGEVELTGVCYPACLPQGTCPAGQGEYTPGTCVPTRCPDQATYNCTCPSTGVAMSCGQPPSPTPAMAPCSDANIHSVDPTNGAYQCSCPADSIEYLTSTIDWVQTTSVLCGWSGYGKKVGPTYCPVSTGMRDKYYVCIKY